MGGILVIILALSNMLPHFITVFYNGIIEVLNGLIHWISSKEAFLFQGIPMSFLMLFASYLFVITLFQVCALLLRLRWHDRPQALKVGCLLAVQDLEAP